MARDLTVAVFVNADEAEVGFLKASKAAQVFTYNIEDYANKRMAAMTREVVKLQELAAAYGAMGADAQKGSAQAIAATKLQESALRKLGIQAISTQRQLETLASKSVQIGRTMTMAVTAPVVAGLAYATKSFVDFQAQMMRVHTQAGAPMAEMQRQQKALLDYAKSGKSPVSPQDLAQGLYYSESRGLRGPRATKVTEIAAQAAGMGYAPMEDVANALGGAVVTGISGAQNFSKAMGVINATVGQGAMTMADYAAALRTGVVPAAKAAGLNLQEVGAALAVMTDRGMPAQMAATRLRMTFAMMQQPTKAATKALGDLGIGEYQLANLMHSGPQGFLKALELLQAAVDKMSATGQRNRAIGDILQAFGKGRSSAGILTLLNSLSSSVSSYQGKLAQIDKQESSYLKDVAAYHKTAAYQISAAWNQIKADFISMGASVAPTVIQLVKNVSALVQMFTRLPKPVKDWLGGLLLVTAALGPIFYLGGRVLQVFLGLGGIRKVVQGLGTDLSAGVGGGAKAGAAAVVTADEEIQASETTTAEKVAVTNTELGTARGAAAMKGAAEVEAANAEIEASNTAAIASAGNVNTALAAPLSKAGALFSKLGDLAALGAITVGVSLMFSSSGDKGAKGFIESLFGAGLAGAGAGWMVGGPWGAGIGMALGMSIDIFEHVMKGNVQKQSQALAQTYQANLKAGMTLGQIDSYVANVRTLGLTNTPAYKELLAAQAWLRAQHNPNAMLTQAEATRLTARYQPVPSGTFSGPAWVNVPKGKGASGSGRAKLLAIAKAALGSPYVWGGAGSGGFDCSGLVMWALDNGLGVNIGRTTTDMFGKTPMETQSQAKPGDIVFTNFQNGKPEHMGIYAGNGMVIAAEGSGPNQKPGAPGSGVMQIPLSQFQVGSTLTFQSIQGLVNNNTPWTPSPVTNKNNPMANQLHKQMTDPQANAKLKKAGLAAAKAIIDAIAPVVKEAGSIAAAAIKTVTPQNRASVIKTLGKEIGVVHGEIIKVSKDITGTSNKYEKDRLKTELSMLTAKWTQLKADLAKQVQQQANDIAVAEKNTMSSSYQSYSSKIGALQKMSAYGMSPDVLQGLSPEMQKVIKLSGQQIPGLYWDYNSVISKQLNEEASTLKTSISKVSSQLKTATGTAKTTLSNLLTTLKSEQTNVNNAVEQNLQNIVSQYQQVYQAAVSNFGSAYSTLISDVTTAFSNQTQAFIHNVLGPKFYQGGLLTPTEQKLQELQDQQKAIQMSRSLAQAQKQYINDVSAGATMDQIQMDIEAIDEAKNAIAMDKLQTQATAERTAADQAYAAAVEFYTQERTAQEHQLSQETQNLLTRIELGTGNFDELNGILTRYGLVVNQTAASQTAQSQAVAQLNATLAMFGIHLDGFDSNVATSSLSVKQLDDLMGKFGITFDASGNYVSSFGTTVDLTNLSTMTMNDAFTKSITSIGDLAKTTILGQKGIQDMTTLFTTFNSQVAYGVLATSLLYNQDLPTAKQAFADLVTATSNLQLAFNNLVTWVNAHTGANIPTVTPTQQNTGSNTSTPPYGGQSTGTPGVVYGLNNPNSDDYGLILHYAHVPGYASGTSYARRGLAMVGERGPELLRMRGGEQVTPLSRLGGGDVHIHVYADNIIGSDLKQAARDLMPPIREELQKLQRRNGVLGPV